MEYSTDVDTNLREFNIAYNNYEMCHETFNNDIANNNDASCKKGNVYTNCSDCLEKSEKKLIEVLGEMKRLQASISDEYEARRRNKGVSIITQDKKKVTDIVKRDKTTKETLMDSIELYKMYRIHIITEALKLVFILFIIFYLLKSTKGVKTSTFISATLYITISVLDVFYPTYMLFAFSALSLLTFVVFAIMNINDISINYQNIANKTTETFSNISTEFKKDVNIL